LRIAIDDTLDALVGFLALQEIKEGLGSTGKHIERK